MKKIALIIAVMTVVSIAGFSKPKYQVVDIYVCQTTGEMANLQAKASVSRKELYRVSYCTCEGVNSSLKREVRDGSCKNKNRVYSCVCIGTAGY